MSERDGSSFYRHKGMGDLPCDGRMWTLPELLALSIITSEEAEYWRSALVDGKVYCTGCDEVLDAR